MAAHDLDYYLSLNYTYQVAWDTDSEAYGAMVLELPGCVATGDTPAEALEALEEAKQAYLEVALAEGWDIPEPATPASYSGKVLVRMASTLHMQLAQWAQQEGTSLNQLITTALAHAVGTRMLQPMNAGTDYAAGNRLGQEIEELIIQARREIEAGTDCESSLAPLRKWLLSTYDSVPLARSILNLADMVAQVYRLAEIRTRQKEQAFLERRVQRVAARVHARVIYDANFSEETDDLAEQYRGDYLDAQPIPVKNWPGQR